MKKALAGILSIALLAGTFAGCTGQSGTEGSSAVSSAESSVVQGSEAESSEAVTPAVTGGETITFVQEAVTDENLGILTKQILSEYEAASGNTIEFETIPESDYRTWLTTQFTAGTGPDVYTSILHDATSDYNKGWLQDFSSYYEQENPYDMGKLWKETLPASILERMYITPEKEVPGYPTSTSVVRIFCNKSLFDQAGVGVPSNWAEFMEICKTLQENDIVPFAFPNATVSDLSWLWFNNSISSQLNNELVAQIDLSGNGFAELNEIVKGRDDGLLDFSRPGIQAGYELLKDFSQYWTSDYNSLDRTTALDSFIRGETAMVQALSGDLRMIDEMVEDSFEYIVMPVPMITTETSEYAMGQSVVLGGQPNIIYSINASLSDTKLAAAVDFVQYMGSPAVQEHFAIEALRIPLATSVQLPEKLSGFIIVEEPLRLNYYGGINEEIRNYFHRAGQQYLEGTITLDELSVILNESYEEVLNNIKAENEWSAENNYQIETAA